LFISGRTSEQSGKEVMKTYEKVTKYGRKLHKEERNKNFLHITKLSVTRTLEILL